jgi:hypothetical protein
VLSMGGRDAHSSAFGLQTQKIPHLRQYPTAVGERSSDSSSYFVLTMGQQGDRGGGTCLRG